MLHSNDRVGDIRWYQAHYCHVCFNGSCSFFREIGRCSNQFLERNGMIVQGISLLCTKKESIGYEIFVYLKFPFGMLDRQFRCSRYGRFCFYCPQINCKDPVRYWRSFSCILSLTSLQKAFPKSILQCLVPPPPPPLFFIAYLLL